MDIKMLRYTKKSFFVSMNNIYKKRIGEIFFGILHNLISASVLLLEINKYFLNLKCFIVSYLSPLNKLERSKT